MKTFKGLKAGTRIRNNEDGVMEVLFWDFYSTGKKVMCFADGKRILPASVFSPKAWEKIKK